MNGRQAGAVDLVEGRFGEILGRRVVWVPSGRVGLYLALRHFLPAGSGVIVSPVNCDAVLSAILASGLRPIFAPVDPETGNLDPSGIPNETWQRARGVLATNLYGIPDRTDDLAKSAMDASAVLVEDACQALDSTLHGRRIGTIAPVAVFSFAKQLGRERGGAIALEDPSLAEPLSRARDALLRSPSWLARSRRAAKRLAVPASLRRLLGRLLHRNRAPSRTGHRVLYDPTSLAAAGRRPPGLDPFEPWLRPDHPRYRERPALSDVRGDLAALDTLAAARQSRIDGARRLFGLGLTPAAVRAAGAECALWRVPLLVRNREAIRRMLVAEGLTVNCIYDPPLDACLPAGWSERCGGDEAGDLMWSRQVVPVDPLEADRVIEVLGRHGGPSPEPVDD